MGDPDEVHAAVSNLIDNAVKYSSSPMKISVEIFPVEGKFVALRVRDQGVGIPKIELKQIFKRFYRVPGPLARRLPAAHDTFRRHPGENRQDGARALCRHANRSRKADCEPRQS